MNILTNDQLCTKTKQWTPLNQSPRKSLPKDLDMYIVLYCIYLQDWQSIVLLSDSLHNSMAFSYWDVNVKTVFDYIYKGWWNCCFRFETPGKNSIFLCFTCQATLAQNNILTIFQNLLQSWNSDRVQQFRRSRNSNNADGGNFRLSLLERWN